MRVPILLLAGMALSAALAADPGLPNSSQANPILLAFSQQDYVNAVKDEWQRQAESHKKMADVFSHLTPTVPPASPAVNALGLKDGDDGAKRVTGLAAVQSLKLEAELLAMPLPALKALANLTREDLAEMLRQGKGFQPFASERFYFKAPDEYRRVLYDLSGKVVFQEMESGGQVTAINAKGTKSFAAGPKRATQQLRVALGLSDSVIISYYQAVQPAENDEQEGEREGFQVYRNPRLVLSRLLVKMEDGLPELIMAFANKSKKAAQLWELSHYQDLAPGLKVPGQTGNLDFLRLSNSLVRRKGLKANLSLSDNIFQPSTQPGDLP